MHSEVIAALAARPFLNEPDTGIDAVLGDLPAGQLPPLDKIIGLPDFDWAARKYLNASSYTFYRNGAAGEFSYRNNLEGFRRLRFRPRVMVDITRVEATIPTTILGHNFSAPFYISPCGRAGLGHPEGELGLVEGAGREGILYIPALRTTRSGEDISAAKVGGQVTFQQVYLERNDTATREIFDRAGALGHKALVFTVDSPADGNRHRAARYGVGSADTSLTYNTWEYYKHLQSMTDLPIIIKGVGTVEDAKLAVEHGAPGIILSNHGSRQLDGSPSGLEVALEIHEQAPEIFQQTEVFADGGVRYGADVLKLLALGVKAVGLGRPFMFANTYGADGVARAAQLLKHEIAIDAANLGVADLKQINSSFVKLQYNGWYS
ncbi:Cytochrome b2 [Colletotrichum orbiculare MAFF 240422]|uniref:Cytochrome b2 n=1 Tax=Colletotrichum orbiculare (strain 104-T / ATCC 96160 / CBS 514.97 / LARS 414 / MAFF 240422) TaxID=1213857 RepID=A0A484FLB8_COLOR|nr:Cytochrome b2 [Colletotrichum orbiculare MAFF 240422]